jgi:hypothetical protein
VPYKLTHAPTTYICSSTLILCYCDYGFVITFLSADVIFRAVRLIDLITKEYVCNIISVNNADDSFWIVLYNVLQ